MVSTYLSLLRNGGYYDGVGQGQDGCVGVGVCWLLVRTLLFHLVLGAGCWEDCLRTVYEFTRRIFVVLR